MLKLYTTCQIYMQIIFILLEICIELLCSLFCSSINFHPGKYTKYDGENTAWSLFSSE